MPIPKWLVRLMQSKAERQCNYESHVHYEPYDDCAACGLGGYGDERLLGDAPCSRSLRQAVSHR